MQILFTLQTGYHYMEKMTREMAANQVFMLQTKIKRRGLSNIASAIDFELLTAAGILTSEIIWILRIFFLLFSSITFRKA